MKYPEPMPVWRLIQAGELEGLEFEVLAGSSGLENGSIKNPRIQKPGLALAGFVPYVKEGRLQIVGASEYAYLDTLGEAEAIGRWRQLIDAGVPAIISAKGIKPPAEVLEYSGERGVPFVLSPAATSVVISTVSIFLERELAPTLQIHGVLMDVFAMGTLIVGDAGIGKSECALELVMRGHRLVADDVVIVRHTHGEGLVGEEYPEDEECGGCSPDHGELADPAGPRRGEELPEPIARPEAGDLPVELGGDPAFEPLQGLGRVLDLAVQCIPQQFIELILTHDRSHPSRPLFSASLFPDGSSSSPSPQGLRGSHRSLDRRGRCRT